LWVVKVTMNEAQSAAFNRMAARDYHKVVACVVEGAAIFDGTMIAKQFGGSFQMSNFTEQSARRIARELDPA
jgi:preprotein translocase subunit SecD